jgi:hypothetical protein
MKRASVFVTMFILGVVCFAQQVVVAVPTFEVRSGISELHAHYIVEVFFEKLIARRIVKVVIHSSLQNVTDDHEFKIEDLSNDKKTAAIGKKMNADCVVRGIIQKSDAYILVKASLFDVNTFEDRGSAFMLLNDVDDVLVKADDFITELFKKITVDNANKVANNKAIEKGADEVETLAEKVANMTDAEFFNYLMWLAGKSSQENRMQQTTEQ